ncbi:hypothetical protein D4764_0109460 [Takifugu flavidus]|uniref:Uncharacterized protein n=1 Tax=Takifugu flavidus TaxID=433684 RepID=A0A5C6ME98_9TELE|nr:hypothetical protein D4764_0109460 [Takifugu flavidus]
MSPSQQDAGDNSSIPGTDRVDELAEYLVELREQTGLTLNNQQVSTILGLWQSLDKSDKDRIVKHKTVCSPAQWPNCCRLVETIFVRLCNIHTSPKEEDNTAISMVSNLQDYKKIRQLVLCNATLMQQTTLHVLDTNTSPSYQLHTYNMPANTAGQAKPRLRQIDPAVASSGPSATLFNLSHTSLDLSHTNLDLPHTSLDLSHTSLDLPHTSLDLSHTSLDLSHTNLDLLSHQFRPAVTPV